MLKYRNWLIEFSLVVLDHHVVFADRENVQALIVALDASDWLDLGLSALSCYFAVIKVPESDFAILVASHQIGVCDREVYRGAGACTGEGRCTAVFIVDVPDFNGTIVASSSHLVTCLSKAKAVDARLVVDSVLLSRWPHRVDVQLV